MTVETTKYLGLSVNNNTHASATARKADHARAFLSRNIESCPKETKKQCYTTLVRPILEYASDVWDPHTKQDIKVVEKVQRRSARFILKDYERESSVTTMLQQLNLPTLRERRAQSKVTTLYKALNGHLQIPTDHLLAQRSITRGHSRRFQVPSCRLSSTKASFYHDTVRLWNSLPGQVVEATTLEDFRARLQPLSLRA